MKYCPYCGVELPDGAVSFCAECGKSLPQAASKKPKKEKKKRSDEKQGIEAPVLQTEEAYDGYYDDVLPEDGSVTGRAVDKNLIKKIALLVGCVCAVIALSVLAMYLL